MTQLSECLGKNFYTKERLLEIAKVSDAEFSEFQEKRVMPCCSYQLSQTLKVKSFFGEHTEQEAVEFYAKGYASWLGIIQSTAQEKEVFLVFSERYRKQILQLKRQGIVSRNPKLNTAINQHIEEEWEHFIKGIYGLCTRSGLPEDIAARELSILRINELIALKELNDEQLVELTKTVNLLDQASSMFAPHERSYSSRYKLVDEVRRQYQLKPAGHK